MRKDLNLPEQKQQQENISAGEGSNLRQTGYTGPQLSKIGLGKVLLNNTRFKADWQNIAQNCTTMRV